MQHELGAKIMNRVTAGKGVINGSYGFNVFAFMGAFLSHSYFPCDVKRI